MHKHLRESESTGDTDRAWAKEIMGTKENNSMGFRKREHRCYRELERTGERTRALAPESD